MWYRQHHSFLDFCQPELDSAKPWGSRSRSVGSMAMSRPDAGQGGDLKTGRYSFSFLFPLGHAAVHGFNTSEKPAPYPERQDSVVTMPGWINPEIATVVADDKYPKTTSPTRSSFSPTLTCGEGSWSGHAESLELADELGETKYVDKHDTMPRVAIIKNLRRRWTSHALAEVLDDAGFAGSYDYVYVPLRTNTKKPPANHGYGFVSFFTAETMDRCRERFDRQPVVTGCSEERSLEVGLANHQSMPQKKRPDVVRPRMYDRL